MKKFKERIFLTEEIENEIQRHKEEYFKGYEQAGFSEEEIKIFKFEEKYKLDFPCNDFNLVYTDVLKLIFNKSDKINTDILSEIIRGLTEIRIDEVVNDRLYQEDSLMLYSEKIMDVFIEKMELLYYFNEDDVFAGLVFSLCNILDLKVADYGFIETSKIA